MEGNGYEFYLGRCLLPVTPSKLDIKISNANKTMTLINEGEINILKMAGLTDIEFTCDIPQEEYPYAVYKEGFRGADYFLGCFEALKSSSEPFQFIVCRPSSRSLFSTNLKVTLEDYRLTEDAGNGADVQVKVRLKQWRDYGTKTVNITMTASRPKAAVQPQRETTASPAPAQATTYTVVKGDCLWAIAKKFYGDGARHTVIYDANRAVVGSNPNRIYPGQVLTIPAV